MNGDFLSALIGIVVIGFLAFKLYVTFIRRVDSKNSAAWKQYASDNAWQYESLNTSLGISFKLTSPVPLQPLADVIKHRPVQYLRFWPRNYIAGSKAGYTFHVLDPQIYYRTRIQQNGARFMFALFCPVAFSGTALIQPARVPMECFTIDHQKYPDQAQSGNFSLASNEKLDAVGFMPLLAQSTIEYPHLLLTPKGFYLFAPYRPDLSNFVDLGILIAKKIEGAN